MIAVEYNSLSALDILKDTPVDLIISDIEMPDLDGISMSQKALEIQPFIKVILVSAYDKFEYAKRAIRLCVYDYIEKPLDYHYLTEKIKNAFTDIDRTQKNTELVKASRPVMTEKFFHDLLHYPGEDPATHLSQYLKYLDLRSDYDFFDVLILETEPDPAKSELDFTQYQIQLLNILNLVKEEMEIFDEQLTPTPDPENPDGTTENPDDGVIDVPDDGSGDGGDNGGEDAGADNGDDNIYYYD